MEESQRVRIVGVGASAGGLEAISQLIAHLNPRMRCAYVVLQHLSPSHRSLMVEILARETPLRVQEAGQGDRPEGGVIYVVPANRNAKIQEGVLHLQEARPEVVPKPSINQFFTSLAAEEGESAIGIVLSGTGSDGAAGLRAIQAAGGFTMVQKPETAKYDGMPRSAIDIGAADAILSPEEMARRLESLATLAVEDSGEFALESEQMARLLAILNDRLQLDFSGYKAAMLLRRIKRREIATGQPDFASYLPVLEANKSEQEALAKDILISVTSFFRDRDAFDQLRNAISEICQCKQPGQDIRVWVAGCATGEEAYSTAILFAEVLGDRLGQARVQIFATDIDDEALGVARRGVYAAPALAEIPSDWVERHFKPMRHAYEVAKHLRDMIVFARHNLVSDPPFLRLDLVSCRNVLIYFDAPLQARVLQTFHFGLVREGWLFLGRSESVAHAESLFKPVERRERLFRKQGESTPQNVAQAMPTQRGPAQHRERKLELLLSSVVEYMGGVAVLCDVEGNVLHSVGQVERLLQFPSGSARLGIVDLAVPALRGEILALLHRCQRGSNAQTGRCHQIDGRIHRLHVQPVPGRGEPLLIVMLLPDLQSAPTSEEPVSRADHAVEDELAATREHLQTLVEEMATANEEMQALNEEAQASNEELQATNEELEAANEELQATNEELVSLNVELSVRTEQLSKLSAEYAHLYDALPFPLMVFDASQHLLRFNAPAALHFELRPTALRQALARLRLPGSLHQLDGVMGGVLAHGEREEVLVHHAERHFRLSVTPGLDLAGQVMNLVVALIDVTDITKAQAELTQSQVRLSALMEKTTVIFAMKDLDGTYLYANRRFLDYFGVDAEDYVGKTDLALLPPGLATDFWRLDLKALRERKTVNEELVFGGEDGQRYLRSVHQVLLDTEGKPSALIMEAEDVTSARLAEDQLRITARVFDRAGEAIIVSDPNGIIQTVNAAFTRISGYSSEEAVGQRTTLLKSGLHSPEFYESMWQSLLNKGFWQGEISNRRKNGEVYPEWLTINSVSNDRGELEHYVAVFSDISQLKDSQRRAEYLSTHDALTGLPNRSLFNDRLRQAIALARRSQQRVAALFIDLDNFKTINDTLGHDVGDHLLKECALRLRQVVRDVDTVSRVGGDEFIAMLVGCDLEATSLVANRIVDEMAASFDIGVRRLFVSASIGVAFFPEDGVDSDSLIKAADAAMYRAKESGRNRVEFFKPDLRVRLLKRAALESGLREAVRHQRLRLVFQPQWALEPGVHLVGAEALLRWYDHELGEVSPAEFVPIAEAGGLIADIDRAAQVLLLQQLRTWQDIGLTVPRISFNLSPRSIREPDYAEQLLSRLGDLAVPHDWLCVEITEGALLESSAHVIRNLGLLREAGIAISIDDFGTGYSSLSYIKRLPISSIKIDKSFVDGLGSDAEDEAITSAILGLAQALSLTAVAEGVESKLQLDWLREHRCEMAQGFLLGKPMTVEAFEDLLARDMQNGAA